MTDKNLPAKKDVLDHAEDAIERFKSEHQIAAAAEHSGAADAYRADGFALCAAGAFISASWNLFNSLKYIRDNKLWRFYAKDGGGKFAPGARIEMCGSFDQYLDVYQGRRGISRGLFRALEGVAEQIGDGAARLALSAGIERKILRAIPSMSPEDKKAVAKLAKQYRDDPDAFAAEVSAIYAKRSAEDRAGRELAEQREKDAIREQNRLAAESEKRAEKIRFLENELDAAKAKIADLDAKLATPGFLAGNEEIVSTLDRVRHAVFAAVGNLERAGDALAVRVEQGHANTELNELWLRGCEFALNLFGQAFGKYLSVLDPGQNYTQFWALNALFSSPGAAQDLAEYEDAMREFTTKSTKNTEGPRAEK